MLLTQQQHDEIYLAGGLFLRGKRRAAPTKLQKSNLRFLSYRSSRKLMLILKLNSKQACLIPFRIIIIFSNYSCNSINITLTLFMIKYSQDFAFFF